MNRSWSACSSGVADAVPLGAISTSAYILYLSEGSRARRVFGLVHHVDRVSGWIRVSGHIAAWDGPRFHAGL